MPELPEVESLKRSLKPFIVGQTISKIEVFKPKLVSDKGTVRQPIDAKVSEFITELTGKKIVDIERVAKNLIFHFESKEILLVHLKMTGQLVYKDQSAKRGGFNNWGNITKAKLCNCFRGAPYRIISNRASKQAFTCYIYTGKRHTLLQ
jgi:formamidopyrimidine-DNA glycosylase